ncbi:hypothetical protein EV361DRAFT_384627 [Lentinula raphanica]|nr:hypothetical protein F5880DRAFT_1608667 [Lentinula raphanica]KAJ3975996.1 hypothetical protein EV361DRAFT_384627 [Lentinula raphanica]
MSSWRNPSKTRAQHQGYRGRGGRADFTRASQNQDGQPRNIDNRHFATIASVSRSSGVEKDGDALKDFKTQEEYREFIQGKLDSYWKRSDSTTEDVKENLLILFRKLREGIVASKRNDAFTIEVCETSLYLATLFNNTRQINSISGYFLLNPSESTTELSLQPKCSTCALVIALINQLILGHPSQTSYRKSIHSIPPSLLQSIPGVHRWITNLSSSLYSNNFCQIEKLTRRSSLDLLFDELLPELLSVKFNDLSISLHPIDSNSDLARKAFYHAVDILRIKARDSAWRIIRTSYRELACNTESETRNWLTRSLSLDVRTEDSCTLDTWLEEKRVAGHIRPKEGVDGRWIVCR